MLAFRIEKVLPHLINPTQTGYVKGRFIGENIDQIDFRYNGIQKAQGYSRRGRLLRF